LFSIWHANPCSNCEIVIGDKLTAVKGEKLTACHWLRVVRFIHLVARVCTKNYSAGQAVGQLPRMLLKFWVSRFVNA
jgi:hypothetical protein